MGCRKTPEAVIAIFSRIPIPAVACRQNHIDHFARRDEMQQVAGLRGLFPQVGQKLAHGCAEHSRILRGIHAMAMQLDKQPFRPALDRNRSPLPQGNASNVGRVRLCKRRALQPKASSPSAHEIREQGALHDERKNSRCAADLQIASPAVRKLPSLAASVSLTS